MENWDTFEIPMDAETYKALASEAQRIGTTPEDLALTAIREKIDCRTESLASDSDVPSNDDQTEIRLNLVESDPSGWTLVVVPERGTPGETASNNRQESGLASLSVLRELRSRLPDGEPVDVLKLIRDGRNDLDAGRVV